MNSQEQMFSPQENQSPRQYNTDPREQVHEQQSRQEETPGTEQASYGAGYSGTAPFTDWMSSEGEKVRPSAPPPSSTKQWIIIALIILVLSPVIWSMINFIFGSAFLVLGLIATAIGISQCYVRPIVLHRRSFLLEGKPALVIRNPAGTIRIHSGATNTIDVMATKYVNGMTASREEEAVDYVQEGNTLRVTTKGWFSNSYQWSPFGGLRNVNLDITVPQHCDLQLDGDAGTVRVEGISGQVRVGTSAGTIDVERATLEGQSYLRTNAGTIHAEQMMLKGQTGFHTNAGAIYFAGTLDPPGYYHFDTNMGTIDAVLPANASFSLDATTDLGTVNNQFGSNIVGAAPHAHLELKTNLGTVTIRKA